MRYLGKTGDQETEEGVSMGGLEDINCLSIVISVNVFAILDELNFCEITEYFLWKFHKMCGNFSSEIFFTNELGVSQK